MEYNFGDIEKKWQEYWRVNNTYKVEVDTSKPKYYVLDMFPYPSGAGLHVGHPLGYIASDIYTRYKRLKGFNVLHPMGYDAFGLPAEQYAIQTGQHPAVTTEQNIRRYREQMDKIGFSYDWDREVRTCDPGYYKWTQWAFIQMFRHYYDYDTNKAEPLEKLISRFEVSGTSGINAACTEELHFTAEKWKNMSYKEQQETLLNYRLAYRAETIVNWCPALGTVLANDEVKDGISVRGGHSVEQRKMMQWLLRISAYAERLLSGLDLIDWSESLKEIQRYWIGKSEGAEILFSIKDRPEKINIFTTRPDTIYGATFMVLAPESELVDLLTIPEKRSEVNDYLEYCKKRSERERIAETKNISGVFTGSYAVHPFTGEDIPVWISEYVLAGYGTGCIMAVPAHDERDYAFARNYNLPIVEVVSGGNISVASYDAKEGILINSPLINGLDVKDAIPAIIKEIEKRGLGTKKVNYRIRDAIFSRQRYWGEPFPVYYKDGIPHTLDEDRLPLELPEVDAFRPTETGEPPLARADRWETPEGYKYEFSTMPGFAGSSAYYLRYMDPANDKALVSREANEYWQDVDLYIGGIEHATGHLVYSRFWNKFLYDTGYVCKDEPFKKLVNQGMIQGRSNFVYKLLGFLKRDASLNNNEEQAYVGNLFLSKKYAQEFLDGVISPEDLKQEIRMQISDSAIKDRLSEVAMFRIQSLHVDINLVNNDILDIEAFRKWNPEYKPAEFILEGGKYICGWAVEKMSKSMYNVVNPDNIIQKYGADTLRMYEMFLGPLEQSKPWDTNGIDGVFKFLRKYWRLFFNAKGEFFVVDARPEFSENKIIHKTIKKVTEDIERFSFNTAVSEFMICVNGLTELKCNKRKILTDLTILLAPFAPHITEEIWHLLGNKTSVFDAGLPDYSPEFLVENEFEYPVSVNGKLRFKLLLPLDIPSCEAEKRVLEHPVAVKWLEGKVPKKVIVVKGKIINIVV